MKIRADIQTLRQTKPHEILIRFLAGGLVTALTGLVARSFGPAVGGLFLAFPAILPASITLIDKHERERKQKAGLQGTKRGQDAAAADAAGAAMGGIALFVFAILVWQILPKYRAWAVLAGATIIWFGVAYLVWRIRRTM